MNRKKLSLHKDTLLALSEHQSQLVAGGGPALTMVCTATQRPFTLCVPTVCHYRDCTNPITADNC